MAETERTAGHADAPQLHEPSDVSARGILWFAGALTLFLAFVSVVLAWLFQLLANREERLKASVYPLAEEQRQHGPLLPPEPRLEGIEPRRRRWVPVLPDEYGWADEKAGLARVPLDKAVERARALGTLRSRQGAPAQSYPSDSSSGRRPRGGQ